ncbi:hypothetical protein GOBAR_AA30369 [Gossypium barbadense]|uniref:Uncharacterized protein n=1 Tax=Gossypium barbadense TaxID=3634 RepID=A0A2P5WGT2_GOSBA|nr:hypothetical protein GOBAR_AA30369 [Gossypium barbadense]
MFSVFVFWVYPRFFYNNDLNCYNGGEVQEKNFLDTKNSQMGFQILTSLMEQINRSLRFEPFETRGANGIVVAGGAACDGKFGFLRVEKKGLSLNLSGENESSKTPGSGSRSGGVKNGHTKLCSRGHIQCFNTFFTIKSSPSKVSLGFIRQI